LFHIDFGHFLGNVKSKLGIKRERAPFIFNPQFAHVLGGSQGTRYAQYVETCQRAYNIVRKHAHMFINLFMMVRHTHTTHNTHNTTHG
jgi:phosphatidylinositol-4,5-bisphosphate 3-kinase